MISLVSNSENINICFVVGIEVTMMKIRKNCLMKLMSSVRLKKHPRAYDSPALR